MPENHDVLAEKMEELNKLLRDREWFTDHRYWKSFIALSLQAFVGVVGFVLGFIVTFSEPSAYGPSMILLGALLAALNVFRIYSNKKAGKKLEERIVNLTEEIYKLKRQQNTPENMALKASDKRKIEIDQLTEEQRNQIKQLIAKDEKYQAAKILSEITGITLNAAIDEIDKLKI